MYRHSCLIIKKEMEQGKKGYTYVMANKTRSVLYIGVTSNLKRRVAEHAEGDGTSFTHKYNCIDLIYFEEYNFILDAISREKQLKNWKRVWKLELIKTVNPYLHDLKDEIQRL